MRRTLVLVLLATLLLPLVLPPIAGAAPSGAGASGEPPAAVAAPLPRGHFEENLGQADPDAALLARHGRLTLLFTATGVAMRVRDAEGAREVRMTFPGASPAAPVGALPLPGRSHYLRGADEAGWVTDARHFGRVEYHGLHEGVDAAFYFNAKGELEYDLLLAPGADPALARVAFEGAGAARLLADGGVAVDLSGGVLHQRAPVAFQERDGRREPVSSRAVLHPDGSVGFEVEGHDPARPLVVDPVIAYETILGAGGVNPGRDVAVDAAGNAYVVGEGEWIGFPASDPFSSAPKSSFPFENEVVVLKLDNAGGVVYSTFLGGESDDAGHGIAVDAAGNAYVTGTAGPNFPTASAFQPTRAGPLAYGEAFLAKLGPAGNALVYSTYLGGTGHDAAHDLALAPDGGVVVVGCTRSTDFPVAQARYAQHRLDGVDDLFVTRFAPGGGSLVFSTYLGGHGGECAHGVALDGEGNVHVVGQTFAFDFPVVRAFQPVHGNAAQGYGADAVLAGLSANGSALLYATFLGGAGYEWANDLALDPRGVAHVVGATTGAPFLPAATPQPVPGGLANHTQGLRTEGFLARVAPLGAALLGGTYVGGSESDEAHAVALDAAGNAYVAGVTRSPDFPAKGLPAAAMQPSSYGYDRRPFLQRINLTGALVDYSGIVSDPGQGDSAVAYGVASGPQENAYVVGHKDAKMGAWRVGPPDPLDAGVPFPATPDTDGDGEADVNETRRNSDPLNPASRPGSDDDADGVENRNESTRAHALGFVRGPAVLVAPSDTVTAHFGAPGATLTLTGPSGARMSVTYQPAGTPSCPGTPPRTAGDVVHDCALSVVATLSLRGDVLSARGAHEPAITVPASAFVVRCARPLLVGTPPDCLVGTAVDGSWLLEPAEQAPRASVQLKVPSGTRLDVGGKVFDDVAPDGGDVTATGSGQNSRDALMAYRLWNWHEQAAGTTYQACSGGLAAPCATEAPPEENALHVLPMP